MLLPATQELLLRLREMELLSADQLMQAEKWASTSRLSPSALGEQLTQPGWLTEWQLTQLLSGAGHLLNLGPYVLLQPIATGGMGQIFLARHRRLRRVVALKEMKRNAQDAPAVQRFLREAQAASLLSHPNIIAVHDAGQHGERHYLAMEYVEGIDLGRLVQQVGPLPFAVACDYARQIALGLQHAHEHGFVHRDIKPSNALVAPRPDSTPQDGFSRFAGGQVKILDMGLVRQVRDLVVQGPLTEQGALLGTLDYLAPEQAHDATRVDGRADLYSLGCTLFFLLTARPVFCNAQPLEKLLRHRDEPPPPLEQLRENVPPALVKLMPRLLAKTPAERPTTAAEVAEALAPLAIEASLARLELRRSPGPISSSELTEPRQELPPTRLIDPSTPRLPRRGRWRLAGVILGVVLFAGMCYALHAWMRPAAPLPQHSPSVDGASLASYWPDNLIGVVEGDLARLDELEPVLPRLAGRCRDALIRAVGMPLTGRVRCLLTDQGVLALSPSGEAVTRVGMTVPGDLISLELAGRPVYLFEAPPYCLTSGEAQLVRQARDFARRSSPRPTQTPLIPIEPNWLKRLPEGQVPLWFSLQLENCPRLDWPKDELSKEMSELLEQALACSDSLYGWLRITEKQVDIYLEVKARSPEQMLTLGQLLHQIQEYAVEYDDADLPRSRVWSPLGKLMRFAQRQEQLQRFILQRTLPRD
ncbi:MAG: serine/threonine-protein kinase [Gemmataceae bacterium]